MKNREEIGEEIRITSYVMDTLPKLSPGTAGYKDYTEAMDSLRKKIQYLHKKLEKIEK